MSYCTVANIKAYYLGKTFASSDDNLNEAEIEVFINEASARIDIALNKYTLPISNPTDLIVLQHICEQLVICKVDNVIKSSEKSERNVCKKAESLLEDLQNGKIKLNSESSILNYCGGDEEPTNTCCTLKDEVEYDCAKCGCDE